MGMKLADLRDARAIAALSPPHVAGYLQDREWEDKGRFGPYGRLYSKSIGGRNFELVLPTTNTIADFSRRMFEALEILSQAEARDPSFVLFDLTLTPFDVVRVRSKDADDYGSVRFDTGIELHEEARKLVIAAALAEAAEKPRKAWKGRRPDSVSQYIDRLRLGQTENASFSLTILSPYSFDPEDQPSFLPDEAFGRRVTQRFGLVLNAIRGALTEGLADPIPAFEKTVERGVSADLCQSLAKLADNDAGIEISVSWSPAKPVREPVYLSLTRQDAAVLHEVARIFSRQEPEPEFVIEGLVEEIKEEPTSFTGSVVIQTLFSNQPGVKKVRVNFEEKYRNTVYDAARFKKWVRVTGDLFREGKSLQLRDPRHFSIIEPNE